MWYQLNVALIFFELLANKILLNQRHCLYLYYKIGFGNPKKICTKIRSNRKSWFVCFRVSPILKSIRKKEELGAVSGGTTGYQEFRVWACAGTYLGPHALLTHLWLVPCITHRPHFCFPKLVMPCVREPLMLPTLRRPLQYHHHHQNYFSGHSICLCLI